METALAERVALCLWRLRRTAAYETAVTATSLAAANKDARSAEPFGGEQSTGEQISQVLEELRKKRETFDLWEGTLRLLEQLAAAPEAMSLDADDVYGAFQDLLDTLPESADAPDVEDAPFLVSVGVPAAEHDEPYQWDGWTAGHVRRGLGLLAKATKWTPERLLQRAIEERRETQAELKEAARKLEREAKDLRREEKNRAERLRQARRLPDGNVLDKVMRYEGHQTRQMLQALHTLERLQAARAGEPVPPPAALDVTINGDGAGAGIGRPEQAGSLAGGA
jgi:hypothetical protein